MNQVEAQPEPSKGRGRSPNIPAAPDAVWLDTAHAARRLSVTKGWLDKLRVYGGGPKFSKMAGRVLYRITKLDAWMETGERSSTSDIRAA